MIRYIRGKRTTLCGASEVVGVYVGTQAADDELTISLPGFGEVKMSLKQMSDIISDELLRYYEEEQK